MDISPFSAGRQQAAALASMHVRPVLSPDDLTYIARDPRLGVAVPGEVGPRFQPRNSFGQFVSYATLFAAANQEYAWTAFDADTEDEGGWETPVPGGDLYADDWNLRDCLGAWVGCDCPDCRP